MSVQQITATALQQRLQSGVPLFLLDVREPFEFQYASITGSTLIPLGQLPGRLHELDRQQETVVICHHGMRSQQAAHFLVAQGFERILNLSGGIDIWSSECDTGVPRY